MDRKVRRELDRLQAENRASLNSMTMLLQALSREGSISDNELIHLMSAMELEYPDTEPPNGWSELKSKAIRRRNYNSVPQG